jgi:hypothetical protein
VDFAIDGSTPDFHHCRLLQEIKSVNERKNMKRVLTGIATAAFLMVPVMSSCAHAEGVREEAKEHPRIRKAIHEMEEALANMEAAPDEFGGHKAAAIERTREAINQLKMALEFRAAQDTRRGK